MMWSAYIGERETVLALIGVEFGMALSVAAVEAKPAAGYNCTAVKVSECTAGSNNPRVLARLDGIAVEGTRLACVARPVDLHPNAERRILEHCPATRCLHETGSAMEGLGCSLSTH